MAVIVLRAVVFGLLMLAGRVAFRALWSARALQRRNSLILYPGKVPTVLGAAIVALGPLVSWLVFATASPEDYFLLPWVFGTMGTLSALGVIIVLRASRALVLVSTHGVAQRALFHSARHISWRSVVGVYYRRTGAIRVVGKATTLTVGNTLLGFPQFLVILEQSLPAALTRTAIDQARRDIAATLQ